MIQRLRSNPLLCALGDLAVKVVVAAIDTLDAIWSFPDKLVWSFLHIPAVSQFANRRNSSK